MATSSRRMRVLVLLVLVVLAVVALGQSFVDFVEASTLRPSVLECRVRATSVGSMVTLRECVRWLDLSNLQLHLRVMVDLLEVVFPVPQSRVGETQFRPFQAAWS
ncbi:hypothetical protein F511_25741 [Dorcoceras hygrometricum]|uniref:Uncharacterized protein n=1 Tax=Dorcoceras hygrometricum TaxID=472368 RepID=A0A2Z7CEV5_9LAMI|nr:hypothetical protein F511_25741 [Dorcoceras hygrometricum]